MSRTSWKHCCFLQGKKNLGKKEAELERRKVGLLKIVLFSKAVESVKDGD